jgi:hypothetical protein
MPTLVAALLAQWSNALTALVSLTLSYDLIRTISKVLRY